MFYIINNTTVSSFINSLYYFWFYLEKLLEMELLEQSYVHSLKINKKAFYDWFGRDGGEEEELSLER